MSEKWVVNCESCKTTMSFPSRETVQELCDNCKKEQKGKLQFTNSYLKAKDFGEEE